MQSRLRAGVDAFASLVARWSGKSRIFSLRSIRFPSVGFSETSLSGRVAARVYRTSMHKLGEGPPGRALRSFGPAWHFSWVGNGGMTRMLGAVLAGLALAELVQRGLAETGDAVDVVPWLLLLAAGTIPLVGGTRVEAAVADSYAIRGAGRAVRTFAGLESPKTASEEDAEKGAGGEPGADRGRHADRRLTLSGIIAAVGALALGAFAGLASPDLQWGDMVPLVVGAGVLGMVLVIFRAELILIALALFPVLNWAARRALGQGLGAAWDEALLLFSLMVVGVTLLLIRRREPPSIPLLIPVAVAFVVAVGSVVVRDVPGVVSIFSLRVTFQPLLFYIVAMLVPRDRRWVRAAITLFLLTSVGLAFHGLYQYATGAPMPSNWVDVREAGIETRAYSIVENPNGLGAFLLLGTMLAGSLALSKLPRGQRLLMAATVVVLLAGVGVTFSRGAWVGLALGVGALLLLAHRRYILPLLAGGLALLPVIPQAFIERLTFAFSGEYIAKSLAAGRLLVWEIAVQRGLDHPWFGVGLGTFGGTSAVLFGYNTYWVDSFYLQLLVEGGIVLLFAFGWILLRAAKHMVAAYRAREGDPYLRGVTAGVFGGFVAVCGANMTASVFETLVVGAGFWFLVGLVSGPIDDEHPQSAQNAPEVDPDEDPEGDLEGGPVMPGGQNTGGAAAPAGSLRILHVIGGGVTGGVMARLLPIVAALRGKGHEVQLLFLGEGGLAVEAQGRGFSTEVLEMRGPFDFRVLGTIRRRLRETDWDVVHTHGMRANLPVRLLLGGRDRRRERRRRKAGGSPPCLVTTVHSDIRFDYSSALRGRVWGLLDRATVSRVDRIVCVSGYLRDLLASRGYPADRMEVILSGIEIRSAGPADAEAGSGELSSEELPSAPAGQESIRVGVAARLVSVKDFDLFLDVAARVHEVLPHVHFDVAGDGPERTRLEAVLAQRSLEDVVHFRGLIRPIEPFLGTLDVCLLTSRSEGGVSLSVLEAMAAGLPVVATAVGGVPELVSSGVDGYLVPRIGSREEVAAQLADGVIRLARSSEERERFGRSARKKVEERFPSDAVAESTLTLYRACISQAGEGA